MPKIVYKFVADASGLTTSLSQVKVSLDKTDKVAASAKATTADLGKQFGQAKESASLLAAGISKVNPQLGALANSASAALGVFKSLAGAMGPIGGVVAGAAAIGGAAWVKFAGDIEKSEKAMVDASAAAIKAQLGMVDSSSFLNEALEQNEKASLLRREGAWRAFARSTAELTAGFNPIAQAVIEKLDALDAAQADAVKAAEAMRDRNIELAQAALDVVEAKKEEEAQTRKTTAASKEATKQAEDEAKAKLQQAIALREAEIDENQATYDAAFEAREADIKDREEKAAKIAELRADMAEDAKAAEERESASTQMAAQASASAWLNAYGAMADAAFAASDDSKENAIAQAVVNGALAATMIMATTPMPLWAPGLIAVAAGVAGSIATIESAHSGMAFAREAQSMSPDEMKITKREVGGVLTPRGIEAAGGPSAVASMNRGTGSKSGLVIVRNQWKNRIYDDFIGDNFARDARLRRDVKAIAGVGGKVGKRTV